MVRALNGKWDVFISHASEDKEDFVRSLAEGLKDRGPASVVRRNLANGR